MILKLGKTKSGAKMAASARGKINGAKINIKKNKWRKPTRKTQDKERVIDNT